MKSGKGRKTPSVVSEATVSAYHAAAVAPARKSAGATARVGLRLSDETKQIVEQAAAVVGMTVNAFVTAQVVERSRQILTETRGLALDIEARDRFLALLDDAAEPNALLKAAGRRYRDEGEITGDRYAFKVKG